MTTKPAQDEWIPHPRDLQNALAAFAVRVRDGKRPAATLMASAHEDGRLFLLIDSLMWTLFRRYEHESGGARDDQGRPTWLPKLEQDVLELAGMTADLDAEEAAQQAERIARATAERDDDDEP
ncbi:hypothetical protein ABGB19_02105 [Mycobacterium sp. B14F4]|uniref:hypothetical protein n=1 Tax=Mycobacterium sp. B14F4 TaxID=3153565 RepID=UPI00325CE8C4